MVELYTIQRYLQYNTLVKNNLQHFDAWASTFGETVTAIELTPEGSGYRAKTRFAKFYNLPELMSMFKEVADIKTADMLKLPVPEAEYHNVSVEPSEMQKDMVASLAERAEKVRGGGVDASVDNMLKITNDGRKLALDQRMLNEMLPDFDGSKINACVENVFRIWEETKDKKSAQLVFCDLSTYCTREHDSLKISNGKWMWWSRGIGGRTALDYLIKVKELSFIEAVETIMGNCAVTVPVYETESRSYEEQPLLLPQKSPTSDVVTQYLFGRGIDYEIINECLDKELIIESLPYHNVVFIGYDDKKEAKYAAYRATNNSRIMGDCTGSKKQYSFRLTNENSTEVHLFECAIDLLSFATLARIEGEDWRKLNLVSLSGVYSPKQEMEKSKVPVTLQKLLEKNPQISRIVLHFDNDIAGRKAAKTLEILLKDRYEVVDEPPQRGKDFNDFLCIQLGILKQNESGNILSWFRCGTSVSLCNGRYGK